MGRDRSFPQLGGVLLCWFGAENVCGTASIRIGGHTCRRTTPLCAGFGFWETRTEKTKKGRKSMIYRLIGSK